jgi:hypothetical protein
MKNKKEKAATKAAPKKLKITDLKKLKGGMVTEYKLEGQQGGGPGKAVAGEIATE